jgi:hypothetical protein
MLTGSVASSLYGEPRATHDIDLVVAMTHDHVDPLVRAFRQPDYYLDARAMHDAIDTSGMFNLIAVAEGDKVDFRMLTGEPFDQSRFARRRQEAVFGVSLQVPSPEDTILAKLRWAKDAGGSEKQFRDALRVFELQAALIDTSYLERWAERLGVIDLWHRILGEAEPL